MRARMVELSWAGETVPVIAYELCCSEKTVRRWLLGRPPRDSGWRLRCRGATACGTA
ncbi:helix-turn-helix domain-containing protein [Streptomyces olivoreticuli]